MLNNLSDLIHLFNNIADNIKRIEWLFVVPFDTFGSVH